MKWNRWLLIIGLVLVVVVCGFLMVRARESPSITGMEWARAIQAIDVPMIVYDSDMRLVDANEAAFNFYLQPRDQLLGKRPTALHTFIASYISNFPEWTAEQTRRQSAGEAGKLNSKTQVPMILTKDHPFGPSEWYITSRPIKVDGHQFYVTRFSRDASIP